MQVKVKKLSPEAVIPQYAKSGDAGLDLTAISMETDEFGNIVYGTGLAFEIPEGFVGLLFPRSSIYKTGLSLSNSVGVIDSGYRGEIIFKFRKAAGVHEAGGVVFHNIKYDRGDRVGQIVILPHPKVELEEVEELVESERGEGGYGSTGR